MSDLSDGSEKSDAPSLSLKPWVILSILIFVILLVRNLFELSWPVHHDCSMFLAAGSLLLEGKVPYVDFIDLNPPLIFYLSAIPALISRLTGLPILPTFTAVVWSTIVGIWLLILLLFRRHRASPEAACFGAFLLALSIFNLYTGEWGQFGQRKQLITNAIALFFVCRWLRWQSNAISPAISTAAGILLGLAMSLSPPYVLTPLCMELTFVAVHRKIKHVLVPEVIAFFAVIFLYAVHFFLLPAASRSYFFERGLPLTAAGYSAYNCGLDGYIVLPLITGAVAFVLASAWLAHRSKATSSMTLPLVLWFFSAYAAAALQGKGWINHYLPMFGGATILFFITLKLRFDQLRRMRSDRLQAGVILALFLLLAAPAVIGRRLVRGPYLREPIPCILENTSPDDSVIIISGNVPDIYPHLLISGRRNGSRYLFQFPLLMLKRTAIPSAKSEEKKERWQKEYDRVVEELLEDLRKSNPRLVLTSQDVLDDKIKTYLQQRYERKGKIHARKSELRVWTRREYEPAD